MAANLWKSFNFFDVHQVKLDEPIARIFEDNSYSLLCSGGSSLFVGNATGLISVLSSNFKVSRTWKAHEKGSITHIKHLDGPNLLVTVAETSVGEPELKVWALDVMDKKSNTPRCQSSINISNNRKHFPITSFVALDNLSQVAVGFANGMVTLVKGDLIHDRGTKQRTIYDTDEPITGLALVSSEDISTLYVATTERVITLVTSARGQIGPPRTVESAGCSLGCMTLNEKTGDVIVVRDDAIYFYGSGGRGPCYAYDGTKSLVALHKNLVFIVSPPQSERRSESGIVGNLRQLMGTRLEDTYNVTTCVLLNTELNYIAHAESLMSGVQTVFSQWGQFFVLNTDGKLFKYQEKSLQEKLDILYQRNLYRLALNLAQKSGVDKSRSDQIHRKYADFLFRKGDYDGAMLQYIDAIENTEPSQVIRKYLEAQRIQNLIEFLEELHRHPGFASADHTTLLLNCYAKLKDLDKLGAFLKSAEDLNYDLETAITMCRQGGYFEQAVFLAEKHNEHETVIEILFENLHRYQEGLDYISKLDSEIVYPNLMRWARILLNETPQATTSLFIEYYTGSYLPRQDTIVDEAADAEESGGRLQNYASLLSLPYMSGNVASPRTPTISEQQQLQQQQQQLQQGAPSKIDHLPSYTPPRPRTAFSCFVDHPLEFITFLEACIRTVVGDDADQADLNTSLFEMYLHRANQSDGAEKKEWESKAKNVVGIQSSSIDPSNVLLLSHLSSFNDGTVLVREKQGLRFDIFRSFSSVGDTAGAIRALKKYGPLEPQLYPAALAYFTSDPKILKEAETEIMEVLQKIDQDGLMAPLQVIQTLSKNAVATMGMVRKYLSDTIERERKEIQVNRRLINNYRIESEVKKKEVRDVGSKPTVFQTTRCAACKDNLDLPAVHFLCKHSFHTRCLNPTDETPECPACAANNATIKAIRRAQEDTSDRHDFFKAAIEMSDNRFSTIGDFFGRGVLSPTLS